jgi:hypothetical protein
MERRRRLDLGQEALGSDDGRQLGLEHLERDLTLVLHVVGQEHRGHAALTEFTLDAVAALEGRVQTGDGVRHQFGTSRFNSSKKFCTRMSR